MHADPHCESTISMTLSGRKKWRLGPPPPVVHFSERTPLYDGGVDADRWEPLFEGEVGPGEAILFPTGFLHQTMNVGADCAASVTYQWQDPTPCLYIRDMLPTLALTEEIMGCWPRWQPYATLLPVEEWVRHLAGANTTSITVVALSVWENLDTNIDGKVGYDELLAWLLAQNLVQTDQPAAVTCFFAFQDANDDGVFELAELNGTLHRLYELEQRRSHPWLVVRAWARIEEECSDAGEKADIDLGELHPVVATPLPQEIVRALGTMEPACRALIEDYLRLAAEQVLMDKHGQEHRDEL